MWIVTNIDPQIIEELRVWRSKNLKLGTCENSITSKDFQLLLGINQAQPPSNEKPGATMPPQ